MPRLAAFLLLALVALLPGTLPAQVSDPTQPRGAIIVRVTDQSGLVLPSAEVMFHYMQPDDKRSQGVRGEVGRDGVVSIGPNLSLNQPGRRIVIHAYAPGYASERLETVWDGTVQQHDIRLAPGRTISLQLNAPWATGPIPDRLRVTGAVDEGKQTAVSHAFELEPNPTYNYTPLRPTGPGMYEFQLREGFDENLYFLVHHPGFIQYYQAGPIAPSDLERGLVTLDLPEPSSIELEFGPHNITATDRTFVRGGVELTFNVENHYNRNERYLMAYNDLYSFDETTFTDAIRGLAPGRYTVQFFLEDATGQRLRVGGEEQVRLTSLRPQVLRKAYDDERPRGTHTVTINVRDAANNLVGGMPFELSQRVGRENNVIEKGIVPAPGQLRLMGLVGGSGSAPYQLSIDGLRLGNLDLREGATDRTISVRLPPRAGDMAPEIVLTSLGDRESLKLSDLRGQVVLLDFWAAWCGPCQKPMAEMDALMARRGADWEGRATILGVNIDETYEAMEKHIAAKGWTNVRHGWSHQDGLGFRSAAPREYGVTGIPTAFLLDPEGRIVWRGHPATLDKEKAIDDLLAEQMLK